MGQFVGFLGISDNQCVHKSGASDLELSLRISLSDLDQLGVASASLLEEITDVSNLLRHRVKLCIDLCYCENERGRVVRKDAMNRVA